MDLNVDIRGMFGEITGNIDLAQRTLHLDFNETEEIEILKPKLKKDEKGWYYETSF